MNKNSIKLNKDLIPNQSPFDILLALNGSYDQLTNDVVKYEINRGEIEINY